MTTRKEQLSEQDQWIKRNQKRWDTVLKNIMQTQEGREFLAGYCGLTRLAKQNAYTGNSDTYFILGMQAVANRLLGDCKRLDFKKWLLMEEEAYERQQLDDREIKEMNNGE